MAPTDNIMKIHQFSKGGHVTHPAMIHYPESTTQEPTITTIQDVITTMMSSISSTVKETLVPGPGGADSNSNSLVPAGDGGANEMTNFNNTDGANMNTSTFNEDGTGSFLTSTGTSFEQVTTTLMDGLNMEHTDDSEEYNVALFIILGVVLGILIIVAVVLGVIYNHYRKRGFQEISGEQGPVDPQSMKQLQQASSQDALLDK